MKDDIVPFIFLLESQKTVQKPADGPRDLAVPYPHVGVDMANPNDNGKAAECRERWKNLRAAFVRNMKPIKSGGGAGKMTRKAYYLSDAMKFAVPYIKALNVPRSENQSGIQNSDKQQVQEQMQLDDDNDSESLPDICLSPQHAPFSPPELSLPKPSPSPPSLE